MSFSASDFVDTAAQDLNAKGYRIHNGDAETGETVTDESGADWWFTWCAPGMSSVETGETHGSELEATFDALAHWLANSSIALHPHAAPDTQSGPAPIDPDTGRPIVYPAHCIIRGACYWLEPLNGGAPFLMSCPVSPGGAIDWGDAAEVGPGECAGYAEIMDSLTPAR